ncbi:unnamed protein product [Adineta steineri]|uniref:Uncharacterized protein n=1 Tax=Adineta steineri TaxID=433720 RepID=A0A814LLU5_9BILA|nr:unnamed protein product [Adineta steineri]CAF1415909.1 unnamed protein product [Adineta steineri]
MTDPAPDAYLKFIGTESSKIRKEIVELTTDLQSKGFIKAIFAVGAGLTGYFTGVSRLQIGMFVAAGISALAANMEFHNCYELGQLLDILDGRGYTS